MGKTLQLLLLIVLLLPACQKDEEIVPMPPKSEDTPPPVAPEEFVEDTRPSLDVDFDLYHSAVFDGMPYRILLPRDYDSTRTYPLHIFLHGIGERGTDNERQLSVGAASFQADSIREKYPAFVVFPQCPLTSYWFSHNVTKTLRGLIENLVADYFIDEEQISIGGYSMGAYGTFEMVASYPRLFKAALAISGDGDEERAGAMAKPTWQIFAGLKDQVVPSSRTEKMAKALVSAGASVSFKLYPHADHRGAWESAFSEPDLFSKLFETKSEDGFDEPGQKNG